MIRYDLSLLEQAVNAQGSKESSFLNMQKDTIIEVLSFYSAKKYPKGYAYDSGTTF